MKWILLFAFLGIAASLAAAGYHMLKRKPNQEGHHGSESSAPTGAPNQMAKALAWRIGLSVAAFVCVLVAYAMGWIQPTGIPLQR